MEYMVWVIIGGAGLAIGVTMTLMAIPNLLTKNPDPLGVLLGFTGIVIGLVIAIRQIRQTSELQAYSKKTELLQRAQMATALLRVYPLLRNNSSLLERQRDIIRTTFLTETDKLNYITRILQPNHETGRQILDTSNEITLHIRPFEPIMNKGLYSEISGFVKIMTQLGNPAPSGTTFTRQLLIEWDKKCEQLVSEVSAFLARGQ